MRAFLLLPLSALVAPALSEGQSPFYPPLARSSDDESGALVERDGNCPSGYDSCSKLGHAEVCCKADTVCSADSANNIGCCPSASRCTGSLTGSATSRTVIGGSTTSGFMFSNPTASATTTTSAAGGASITGSTIANAAYPFIVIPTSFSNAAECTSYYRECQTQYSSCTASLGGANGVTVAGGGAGVTVAGATVTGNGQSICSSLSQKACHGLQQSYCTAVGTGNNFENNPGGSGQAKTLPDRLYCFGVGLAIAIAGFFV